MLGKLLAAGDVGQWSSFVTPAFFDVVPARPLWRRFQELARGRRDAAAYQAVLSERRELLERSRLAITVEGPAGRAVAPGDAAPPVTISSSPQQAAEQATERATRVVELYFHQLLHGGVSLLDLREQAFPPALPLKWRPAAWFVRWDADFLAALRQLYAGFYQDDSACFRAGLAALSLSSAEAVFRQHFGDGQRAVRFRVQDFVATFHRVFSICRDARVQLHPDFLPLGLYLATLYDHLEKLGAPVDVFSAFHAATALRPPPSVTEPSSAATGRTRTGADSA